ncbi:glycoside hydrolase [Ophiobolus disseminans]|uniref:Glycoside hydrolase n=1 Tax=Ophiobolus disseminans TaxID=1469910 RepID=A0A6A7A3Z8_9PLEO|nr:glycoside hydrolase [Ophiobolus disseminans]
MKSIVLASALAAGILVGTANSRPLINQRALVTEVVFVTETIENVVVYVDKKGAPYLTTTEAKTTSAHSVVVSTTSVTAQPTTVPSPAPQVASSPAAPVQPVASASSAMPSFEFAPSVSVNKNKAPAVASAPPYVAPSPSVHKAKPTTTTPPPSPTEKPASSPPAPAPQQFSSSPAPAPEQPGPPPPSATSDVPAKKADDSGVLPMGITYDPFKGSAQTSDCKSEAEFASDFEKMKDYKAVRLYGQGCNQIPWAVKAAVKQNQKLMAGVYMSNKGGGEDLGQVIRAWKSAIDRYGSGNWNIVALFSVENERVNDHDMTASDVVDAIKRARDQLRAAGYNGPVGAVETVPATVENPSICDASDVAMVNCHAFFDSDVIAENAGKFVRSEIDRVKQACNNKRVVVTESGWPHQGDPNGKAFPNPENQRLALESIRAEFSNDMFLHNAFDATWKSDFSASFNAERYWGIIQ